MMQIEYYTPDLRGLVERSDIEIVKISICFIKQSTWTYLAGFCYMYDLNNIQGELRV